MGHEGEHIQHMCAIIDAADAPHRQYDHHDRRQSGATIRQCVVP
jgi:hypothetical protein